MNKAAASPKGKNSHGLDARYFHEKLSQLVRDVDNYTQEEMGRALQRLSETAQPDAPDNDWNGCYCGEWGKQGECVKCGEHYTDQWGKIVMLRPPNPDRG